MDLISSQEINHIAHQNTQKTTQKTQGSGFVPFPPGLKRVRLVRRRNRFAVEARWDPEETLEARSEAADLVEAGQGIRGIVEARRDAGETGGGSPGPSPGASPESADAVFALHLPNSGRMSELLQPGVLGLAHIDGKGERRTIGRLLLVQYEGRWVSVDAHMPNRLFARCLEEGILPPFIGYTVLKAEVPWGQSRVDFLLARRPSIRLPSLPSMSPTEERLSSGKFSSPGAHGLPAAVLRDLDGAPTESMFLVETKSCNLVVDGLGLFPDAPTARGTRHLKDLIEAVNAGYRAAVVWFVQRDDARALAPHAEADPEFALAFKEARAAGVEAYAYRCLVEPSGMKVLDEIPVCIDVSEYKKRRTAD